MDMTNSLENILKEGFQEFCTSHNLTEAIYAHLVGRIVQVKYDESGCLLKIAVDTLSIRCYYSAELGNIPDFRHNDWVEIFGTLWMHTQVYSLSGINIVDVAPTYDHNCFTEVYMANAILEKPLGVIQAKLILPNLSVQESTIRCNKSSNLTKEIPCQTAHIYGHLIKHHYYKYHDIILDVDEII